MSTGAECYIIEKEPGKWYYKLQLWPYGEWDEYLTEGPFKSEDRAIKHLSDNHANPGGWSTYPYEEPS